MHRIQDCVGHSVTHKSNYSRIYLLRENNRHDNLAQIQVRFIGDDSEGLSDIKDYEIIITHFVLKD